MGVTEKLSPAIILDWESGRSPRVCRSTLCAEAISADEGTDCQCHINCYLTELLSLKTAWKWDPSLAAAQCTDSKSLYDCLTADSPALTDRRSMVQIRSVQQALRPSQIRWVGSRHISDGSWCVDGDRCESTGCLLKMVLKTHHQYKDQWKTCTAVRFFWCEGMVESRCLRSHALHQPALQWEASNLLWYCLYSCLFTNNG